MTHSKFIAAATAIAIGLALAPPADAARTHFMLQEPDNNTQTVQPDNTKINQRDRSAAEVTADKQGSAKQDRETTRAIRRAIIKDKGLSSYAHNVKIITKDGLVTLKGPVRSEAERQAVLNAAKGAGGNVTDEMSIKK